MFKTEGGKAQQRLLNVIAEGRPADIVADLRSLQAAASAELACLRKKSGQADILLYLDKPNGSWSIDGNEDDRFVSIGKNDDVDFAAALESLNQTTPVCQITPPPPSQEDLDQDSTLVYKSNASFQAVFQASTKRKWYLDKREQLELQLAYLGLIYLKAQDELFVSKPLDAKRVELAQIVPRLVAFAGFSSFDSYEDIKEELVNSIVEAKFPLLWIFFQSGRLVFVYSRSAGAEIMQQKMDISEIKDMIKDMVRQIKDIAERSSIN
ncbi:hypothetical protein MIR68_008275 [Amoeboaphelidium protococcarum]|nr:hypothetical protein MIR68_008275 [Amoeboaphelidium protococcarum]